MASVNTPPSSVETDQVLVEEKSSVRVFVLNRPKQLNALSHQMLSRLLQHFLACEKDPTVKSIILKGKGRAFCAGGDVTAVIRHVKQGNWKAVADYFKQEYILNYVIATCNKPQVSILNGIVLGGGAGVSIHGRYRVATENTLFAMPEATLGAFPDVGASYFLSRLPGFFGEYVGLTGARLDGADMLACGLATHFVHSERLSSLEEKLIEADSSDPAVISSTIEEFSVIPNLKKDSAYHRLKIFDRCFSRRTIEDIISALETEAANNKDDWISITCQSLKKASPTSLKIALRSIRLGRLEGIGRCLVRDFRVICHVMRGEFSKDFVEGCRAMLIDKDRDPKWRPSKLETITDGMVDRYFSAVDEHGFEDLKLPVRSSFRAYAVAKL